MSWTSRKSWWWSAVFAILCGLCVGNLQTLAEEAPTYQLRFQFTPGQTWQYVSQNDAAFVIEYAQAKDTVTHTSMFLRHFTIVGVNPDGSADVELMLDRACMTSRNAGVTSRYDSQDTKHIPNEFSKVHLSIGKSTIARLTPLGVVVPIADKPDAADQVELLFQLPEQPVSVGAIWKERFEVSVLVSEDGKLFRPLKMERRFKLTGVENGIATISLVTVCLTPVNDSFQESQLIQRKPSGTMKFDLARGCLIDRQLEIDDKSVGHQGAGSALSVQLMKVDRLVEPDQLKQVDLTKPLIPVRVASEPVEPSK